MIDPETLGKRLRNCRQARGLSQSEVAEKLDGINRSALSKIENGNQKINSLALKALSELYGQSVNDLLAEPEAGAGPGEFGESLRSQETGVSSQEIHQIEQFCENFQFLATLDTSP